MIDIATVGWLTMDDIVLLDHSCRPGVMGGGALYSAIGARIWSDGVGVHSVTGRAIHENVGLGSPRGGSTARASAPSMARDCSSGCCTRARRSSDRCPSSIRRPPKTWIAAEVRCLRPIGERAAFMSRRRSPAGTAENVRTLSGLAAPAGRDRGYSFGRIDRPPPVCRSWLSCAARPLSFRASGDLRDLGAAGHWPYGCARPRRGSNAIWSRSSASVDRSSATPRAAS